MSHLTHSLAESEMLRFESEIRNRKQQTRYQKQPRIQQQQLYAHDEQHGERSKSNNKAPARTTTLTEKDFEVVQQKSMINLVPAKDKLHWRSTLCNRHRKHELACKWN